MLKPVTIRGDAPGSATVHYTVTIPGFILDQGQVAPSDGVFEVTYDPEVLHQRFPNVDLVEREYGTTGLADTVLITLLATGPESARATTVSIQGEHVAVGKRVHVRSARAGRRFE
jgi:hypothetical protein